MDAGVSTETPAERPAAAPKATPASTPTPGPTATPAPPAVLAPLQALDISALLSELSANELACIGDDAGKLVRSLAGPGQASGEEQAKFFGCLEDETVARIFLAGFAPGPGPLSLETSDCVRAGVRSHRPQGGHDRRYRGRPGEGHGREHGCALCNDSVPERPGVGGNCLTGRDGAQRTGGDAVPPWPN